jgi:hypothetical protein
MKRPKRIKIEQRIHDIIVACQVKGEDRSWTAAWNIVRLVQNNYRRRKA